jgi:protoporphyrinogen oxidase
VSSAPLRETIPSIDPLPACASLTPDLRYRDFILVALILDKPSSFHDNWIYIHDPSVKAGRVQNFEAWSPSMIPKGGKGCLGVEYFCQEGDDFWRQSEKDLIDLATRELESLGLVKREQVVDGCVVRQPKAYPCYDGTYQSVLDGVRKEMAEKFPTFHMIGRNGMHRYNNQDHAMMTGLLTAENILANDRVYNVWAVNEDADYHEEGA